MSSKRILRSAIAALVLTVHLSGCESDGRTLADRAFGPEVPVQSVVVQDESGQEYTLIQGQVPGLLSTLKVTKLLGLGGGTLTLAGHTLRVPLGAVSEPTVFTMLLLPNGLVEVELTALRLGLLGAILGDVGSSGFRRPVEVALSYSWATNVTDPSQLVILRRPRLGVGPHEVLPSAVDASRQVVRAELGHFSRYCLASN